MEDCKQLGRIAVLEQRDASIIESLQELKQKTDLILMQVTKVAVLEVNHSHQSEALARAFTRIEQIEKELTTLSKETREFMHTVQGMSKMAWYLWGGMGAGMVAMLSKVMFNV